MTTAQVVETSVTNNSLSKDPHPDDHGKQINNMYATKKWNAQKDWNFGIVYS